jgi:hypothetical protein
MAGWQSIWISQLIIPLHVAIKISAKHGLEVDEIRELVIGQRNLFAQEISSIKHGLRHVVVLRVTKQTFYLLYVDRYGNDDSVWVLRTAIRASHPSEFRR